MRKVLVTGSSGLVGSNLMTFLPTKGYEVVGYDRSRPQCSDDDACYEKGDLCDFPRLASIIQKHNIQYIAHCGAVSAPSHGVDVPYQTVQTNIVGTVNVFEAAKLFGIKKVVFLSSASVYGNNPEEKVGENAGLEPTSVYGVTKLTGEKLADVYTKNYKVPMISFRFSTVYGPGSIIPDDEIKLMLESALKGEAIDTFGGTMDLELMYVKDAVRAIELALSTELPHHAVYNIGTGVKHSLRTVGTMIQELFPGADILPDYDADGNEDILGAFDISKAQRDLGYKPQYSLREGLRDYALYLQGKKMYKTV